MKKVELQIETRKGRGKGDARRLREKGRVPAVLYGHGQETLCFSVVVAAFHEAQAAGQAIITLVNSDGDGSWEAIVKNVVLAKVRRNLQHVDFQRVLMDEKIKASVPLRIEGEPQGVRDGGVLQHILWDVEVLALPGDLPEALTADISSLGVGEALSIGDIQTPPGVELLLPPETAVVSVMAPRSEAEAETVAAETEETETEQASEPAAGEES